MGNTPSACQQFAVYPQNFCQPDFSSTVLKRLMLKNPLFLLLSTGLLLGLYAPIGKYVGTAGLNPFFWAIIISFLPGLVLWGFAGTLPTQFTVFGLVAGLTAYVIPNSLAFAAVPHVGAGYVGLMFAISPVFTALLSIIFNIRPPDRRLCLSVVFGFTGAVLIVFNRLQLNQGAESAWPLIAFLMPVSLEVGNVWRTARWPAGSTPIQVGAAANLGAIPFLLVALAFYHDGVDRALQHPWLIITQMGVSLAMFMVFFRLQLVGGPTYLSQIGYVAAAVSLIFGTTLFDEVYPWPIWAGAGLIAIGVVISNWPRST
jgi:drug/metabolite transporter (DMT)-like permease